MTVTVLANPTPTPDWEKTSTPVMANRWHRESPLHEARKCTAERVETCQVMRRSPDTALHADTYDGLMTLAEAQDLAYATATHQAPRPPIQVRRLPPGATTPPPVQAPATPPADPTAWAHLGQLHPGMPARDAQTVITTTAREVRAYLGAGRLYDLLVYRQPIGPAGEIRRAQHALGLTPTTGTMAYLTDQGIFTGETLVTERGQPHTLAWNMDITALDQPLTP